MPRPSRLDAKDGKRPFYSEHVYPDCCNVWSLLDGANGCDLYDFIEADKLLLPSRLTILHDIISRYLEFLYGELFFDSPDTEINTHRSVVIEAGLKYPLDAEKRIISGKCTFEDKRAVYRIINLAMKTIDVPCVFHTLFADRNFISALQQRLRTFVIDKGNETFAERLSLQNKIRRVYLPTWLKKGIFFRDRGICQICGKDVSGLRSPLDEIHIDHIVPLGEYGNNDPTNFQLACRGCNINKGIALHFERTRFMQYWSDA